MKYKTNDLGWQRVSPGGLFAGVPAGEDFAPIRFKRNPREPDTISYDQWLRDEGRRRRAGSGLLGAPGVTDAARRQTARPTPLGSRNTYATDALRRRRLARLLNEQKRDVLRRAETRRRNFGKPAPGHVVSGLAPYKQRLERIGGNR